MPGDWRAMPASAWRQPGEAASVSMAAMASSKPKIWREMATSNQRISNGYREK